jgi:hypothetical protein
MSDQKTMKINLPSQFVEYWKGSQEYVTPLDQLNPWEKAFRQAYEAHTAVWKGNGYARYIDVSDRLVMSHLTMLADEFSTLCTPRSGNDYTYNEGRAARILQKRLTDVKASHE